MNHERVLRDHLITQKLQGAPTGQLVTTTPDVVDDGQSAIGSVDVIGHYELGRKVVNLKDSSDDKIVIGYNNQGLPFQIVVQGFHGGDTALTFDFIDLHVLPLMNSTAKSLSVSHDPNETIKSLIRRIFELRQHHAQLAVFTMAVGITYEKSGSLYCAGFGIGNCGLVLKAATGEQTQLAFSTEIHTKRKEVYHDGFSLESQNKIETVINRNTVFSDIRVQRGDELVGYTFIFPEWKTALEPTLSGDEKVYHYKMPGTNVGEGQSLCAIAISRTQETYLRKCEKAASTDDAATFGDDATFSTVRIPETNLQAKLAGEIATPGVNDNLAHRSSETLKNQLRKMIYDSLPPMKKPEGEKSGVVQTASSLFKVQFHCNRTALLYVAIQSAPSEEACIDLIEHQLSFYTMKKGEIRAPLPAWVPSDIKSRLQQEFHYPPFNGKNGLRALLEKSLAVAKHEIDADSLELEEKPRSRGCNLCSRTPKYTAV